MLMLKTKKGQEPAIENSRGFTKADKHLTFAIKCGIVRNDKKDDLWYLLY